MTPMDLSGLKTVSLKDRGGKVKQQDFAQPFEAGSGIAGLIASLPAYPRRRFIPSGSRRHRESPRTPQGDHLGTRRTRHQMRHGASPDRSHASRPRDWLRDEWFRIHPRFRNRPCGQHQRRRGGCLTRWPLRLRRRNRPRVEQGDHSRHRSGRSPGQSTSPSIPARTSRSEPGSASLSRENPPDSPRGIRNRYSARPPRLRSASPRRGHPPGFPPVLYDGCRAERWWRLHQLRFRRHHAGGLSESRLNRPESRPRTPRLHHRESGFPPALPPARERSRTPARRQAEDARLLTHGPPRNHDSTPGRGAD